jgi:cytochrome b6-f complex iron-sulfur subunit
MADESKGILGHLPPWPRAALNNSVIAMEQAYRKRKNLPLISDADVEALKAGQPMSWESGDGVPAPAPVAAAPAETTVATSAAPATAAPVAAPPPAASGDISPDVAKWVAEGKKWSKSAIAAEQARRKRKAVPALNDAEVVALLGEPLEAPAAPAAAAPAAPAAARPATAAPAAAAVARATVPPLTRTGVATSYVGSPAVGTSKAAAAGGVAATGPDDGPVNQARRMMVWSAVAAFLTTWFIAFFRFFLPRTLFEPNSVFKIGYPADYGLGIDERWLQKYRIWVDRTPDRLFVIYARCTHLGCTPNWKPAENKFKCPCHGSGYDNEGVNFEGPAPRPMDRAHIDKAPDGQIVVDVSRLYSWPKGQPSKFNDPGAFLPG